MEAPFSCHFSSYINVLLRQQRHVVYQGRLNLMRNYQQQCQDDNSEFQPEVRCNTFPHIFFCYNSIQYLKFYKSQSPVYYTLLLEIIIYAGCVDGNRLKCAKRGSDEYQKILAFMFLIKFITNPFSRPSFDHIWYFSKKLSLSSRKGH